MFRPATCAPSPVGTGPFKFVEFKANESIKLARNPDYWKKGLPHLDGIEFTIIPNRSTAILGFVAGKFDMTFPTEVSIPLLKDVKAQAPNAVCVVEPINVSTNIIVNSSAPPFDNLDIRRAMALALDRKPFVSILNEGQADIGGTMLPAPGGLWAMPKEMLETIPGYGPDINANREQARKLMQKAGYGPDKHLAVKVSTRNIPVYRDPAVILIDQLKSIYIDGELDVVETANWFSKVARKDYALGLNLTGNAVDDPDQSFYENYSCNSERNYTNYCNKDIEKLFDQQSQETDVAKRKKLVWEIDKKLQEDVARPIIFHGRQGSCWQPYVKGITIMVNSSYNGYRYEDVWLDKITSDHKPECKASPVGLELRVFRIHFCGIRANGSSQVFAYIVRRLVLMLVTLFGISVIIFVLLRIVPGNIVDILFDAAGFVDPADKAHLEQELGLDQSIVVQYLHWIGGLLHGDLGYSYVSEKPALDEILPRIPITARLAGLALLLSASIGIPLGVISAVNQGTRLDYALRVVSLSGLSLPSFWLGLLILMASVSLFGSMPIFNPNPKTWTEAFAIYCVPAMAVGFRSAALTMRITRSSMLETLRQDYIRTARAKGASEASVNYHHALKNAILPVITVIGIEAAFLIGGLIVTETVFNIPGVARFLVEAIRWRDYPIVQNLVMLIAVVVVVANFTVDMLYAVLDPRIRYTD